MNKDHVAAIVGIALFCGIFFGLTTLVSKDPNSGVSGVGDLIKGGSEGMLVMVLVIAGIVIFVLSKGKNKEGEENTYGFKANMKQYAAELGKEGLRALKDPLVDWVLEQLDVVHTTPAAGTVNEEWNTGIRKVWMEFFAMMNYSLRLEVYASKFFFVSRLYKTIDQIYKKPVEGEGSDGTLKYYDSMELQARIDFFKNGGDYEVLRGGEEIEITPKNHYYFLHNHRDKKGDENKISFKINAAIAETETSTGEKSYGYASDHHLIFELFKDLKIYSKPSTVKITAQLSVQEKSSYPDNVAKFLVSEVGFPAFFKKIHDANKKDSETKRGTGYVRRRRQLNKIIQERLIALNQFNLYGQYAHNYKYARPGASILTYPVVLKQNSATPPTFLRDPFYSIGSLGIPTPSGNVGNARGDDWVVDNILEYEVNWDGYFLEDLNNIKIHGPGAPRGLTVRRVMPIENTRIGGTPAAPVMKIIKNVIDHPDFREPLDVLETDWEFFIRDVRTGLFHPNSLLAQDYDKAHRQHKEHYEGVVQESAPAEGNPIFDRSALIDTGKLVYWGISDVENHTPDQIIHPPNNPFPGLSTRGFGKYLKSYLEHLTDEAGQNQQKRFTWDSGLPQPRIFSDTPEETEGGTS